MENNAVQDRVRRVIEVNLPLLRNAGSLDASADLYSAGMSSLSSVNLMLALENEFDLEFPPDVLNRSAFQSIDAITKSVERLSSLTPE